MREAARALDDPLADVDALQARLHKIAPRDYQPVDAARETGAKGAARRTAQRPKPPFRRFLTASGRPILVGRGAAHNDELTLHVARPRDLWLHAREWSGAHVVVPLGKGESCPPEVLVDAAHLAAHFSGAREEAIVEITYGLRKHVRKPRGSAPGTVVLDREKVLVLRRQDAVMERLLSTEAEP
jgi:predicted ribosome quality control (RQC) complex YloA/Tae2 family protein